MSYENFCCNIELILQNLLKNINYNTVNNILTFYKVFRKSGNENLAEFFRSYSPPITLPNVTCVGLALELCNRLHILDLEYPDVSDHFFIASCEEKIPNTTDYIATCEFMDSAAYFLEKEHVLLGIKFSIGNREGVLLCDPGYHVGRVITVMMDKTYPNTGWFTQSDEDGTKKEFNYKFSDLNPKFIEWHDKTTANSVEKSYVHLIYVAKAYLTPVEVTERRNLVYNFRSMLSRDQKGHVISGFYFKVAAGCHDFTMFYRDIERKKIRLSFKSFMENEKLDDATEEKLIKCNEQLGLPSKQLPKLFKKIGYMLDDKEFIEQLLQINTDVAKITDCF